VNKKRRTGTSILLIAGVFALLGVTATAVASKGAQLAPWQEAAKRGDAHAEYLMGNAYAAGMPGLGIKKDLATAFTWYMKAARQNDVDAQYEVGAAYILGEGVKRDLKQARIWLKRAADGGHKDARDVLASFPEVAGPVSRPTRKPARRIRHGAPPAQAKSEGGFEIGGFHVPDPRNMIDPGAMIAAVMNVQFFNGYWPWWLGAIALGFVTIGFWMTMRTTLGVSSSWDRLVSWREDRNMAKAAAVLQEAPTSVLESAMMAATMEQFGDEIPDELVQEMEGEAAAPAPAPSVAESSSGKSRTPVSVHVTFLASMVVGGALATFLTHGGIPIHFDMGGTFTRLFGDSPLSWGILAIGGVLIGFGTRMGGGCTSGHGLSGCSRLQPGSLVGTAAFFGTAILVSMLLELRV
jgi:uncharacterized membrane protein YedE/YeeE